MIIGDFELAPTLETVTTLFGPLENDAESPRQLGIVPAADAIPMSAQAAPIVLKQPAALPLLNIVYPLPNANHPDSPAIDILDTLLTGGRSARLPQALVETGIAAGVQSMPKQLREPGWYTIQAAAIPGRTPTEIYETLLASIEHVRQSPIDPAELAKAKEQYKASIGFFTQEITSQGTVLR